MAYGIASAAGVDPDGLAVTDGVTAWTWAELNSLVNRTVAWLRSHHQPGQRVAIMAENSAHTALAHLAVTYAGLSAVPVNALLTAAELAYIVADADARTVLCSARSVARVVEAGAGVRVVSWGDPAHPDAECFDGVLAEGTDGEPPEATTVVAPLYYTSGTTGFPKGVELPVQMFPRGGSVVDHVEALRSSGIRPSGRHLVVGPLHHTGPIGGVRGLELGITAVILGRFDAERVLAAIEEYRIEHSVMVPTHFSRLLALPEPVRQRYDVSSLRRVVHTGAACPLPVKRAMIDWFGPVLIEAYGSTEAGTATVIDSTEWLAHPGSVGRALPGVTVSIRDAAGSPMPTGHDGLVCLERGDGRGPEYHNDPAKTARSYVAPGVFVIGEIGHLDADGYLYLTDRATDMVVSGGVNLYPAESEAVLRSHPAIADVAVIGVPHDDLGEALVALAVPAGDSPPPSEQIVAWCRDRLSHYKCPADVQWVADDLRSSMGKLNKRELRARYLDSRLSTTAVDGPR